MVHHGAASHRREHAPPRLPVYALQEETKPPNYINMLLKNPATIKKLENEKHSMLGLLRSDTAFQLVKVIQHIWFW